MGGVWVFPGGAVDAHEGEGDSSHRLAAIRELEEEAGIAASRRGALVKFSQWITPRQVAIRFDTHFFLAACPAARAARSTATRSWTRAGSPRRARSTRTAAASSCWSSRRSSTSSSSAPFASATELLDHAAGREVVPVEPRVIREGEVARVVLPGEPGYDDGPELIA